MRGNQFVVEELVEVSSLVEFASAWLISSKIELITCTRVRKVGAVGRSVARRRSRSTLIERSSLGRSGEWAYGLDSLNEIPFSLR